MSICTICPRECGIDREKKIGYCGAMALPNIARAALHFWEEPCISGTHGSGAIFFSGCNLNCVFCQNHEINHTLIGESCDAERLSDIMLALKEKGAHNINLVTPSPHVEVIIEAVALARKRGLTLPIIYNTNSYEKVETLKMLRGTVDVYLPDLKYVSSVVSKKYSGAEDYFDFASLAVQEMFSQVGTLVSDENGIAQRGVIIRHLVLPGSLDETRCVLDYIAHSLPRETYISLMSQYVPCHKADFAPLNRRLLKREYSRAIDYCMSLGFENVYIQELTSAKSDFTPEFNGVIVAND